MPNLGSSGQPHGGAVSWFPGTEELTDDDDDALPPTLPGLGQLAKPKMAAPLSLSKDPDDLY